MYFWLISSNVSKLIFFINFNNVSHFCAFPFLSFSFSFLFIFSRMHAIVHV